MDRGEDAHRLDRVVDAPRRREPRDLSRRRAGELEGVGRPRLARRDLHRRPHRAEDLADLLELGGARDRRDLGGDLPVRPREAVDVGLAARGELRRERVDHLEEGVDLLGPCVLGGPRHAQALEELLDLELVGFRAHLDRGVAVADLEEVANAGGDLVVVLGGRGVEELTEPLADPVAFGDVLLHVVVGRVEPLAERRDLETGRPGLLSPLGESLRPHRLGRGDRLNGRPGELYGVAAHVLGPRAVKDLAHLGEHVGGLAELRAERLGGFTLLARAGAEVGDDLADDCRGLVRGEHGSGAEGEAEVAVRADLEAEERGEPFERELDRGRRGREWGHIRHGWIVPVAPFGGAHEKSPVGVAYGACRVDLRRLAGGRALSAARVEGRPLRPL